MLFVELGRQGKNAALWVGGDDLDVLAMLSETAG